MTIEFLFVKLPMKSKHIIKPPGTLIIAGSIFYYPKCPTKHGQNRNSHKCLSKSGTGKDKNPMLPRAKFGFITYE